MHYASLTADRDCAGIETQLKCPIGFEIRAWAPLPRQRCGSCSRVAFLQPRDPFGKFGLSTGDAVTDRCDDQLSVSRFVKQLLLQPLVSVFQASFGCLLYFISLLNTPFSEHPVHPMTWTWTHIWSPLESHFQNRMLDNSTSRTFYRNP